jgi:hypothetical protein
MPQDYFLRLIEQISIMLAEIARLKNAGDKSGATAEISVRCRETVGLDVSQVQQMSPEALAQVLDTAEGLRQCRAIMLAELLLQDAEMHSEDAGRESLDRLHAFCLIAGVVHSLDTDDQRIYREKLEGLRSQLKVMQSNPYIASKLAQYAATPEA